MDQVTCQNWSHSGRRTSQLQAFVHLAGSPSGISYCVTLGDQDFREIVQWDFELLQDAVDFLNRRYGHWTFYDLADGQNSAVGCASCAAH